MLKFRIQKLMLEGFRGFEKAELHFPASNLLLLIGDNGKGKTAILDSISYLWNDFVKQLKPEHRKGISSIQESDINKIVKKTMVQGTFETDKNPFLITLTNGAVAKKDLKEAYHSFLTHFQQEITLHPPAPILAYYQSVRFFKPLKDFKNLVNSDKVPKTDFSYYDILSAPFQMTFEDFQTWFRLEEDQENDTIRRLQDFNYTSPELAVIRKSIHEFFNYLEGGQTIYTHLRVQRTGVKSKLMIQKNQTEFELEQLSDGERMLLLIVCDIARRLALAQGPKESNSLKVNSLEGCGIVLIDEIDMHLHPKWQGTVLSAFHQTFPNIQFIVASHSTQVLSQVRRESIRILDNGTILMSSSNPIGRDANAILEEIQQVSKRPKAIETLLESYFTAIHYNRFTEAAALKNNLLAVLDKEDPVFAKAEAMITRKKLLMP
jgi:predicted ATP-binding protein involved in virulence